jgi:hypothetical protein
MLHQSFILSIFQESSLQKRRSNIQKARGKKRKWKTWAAHSNENHEELAKSEEKQMKKQNLVVEYDKT